MRRAWAASAAGLVLAACSRETAAVQSQALFAAISDWGGTDVPPYTLPGQVAAASGLDQVRLVYN